MEEEQENQRETEQVKVKKVDKAEGSPVILQYERIKAQYSDCVLFFRLGDFYELFNEDAIEISKVLELTLTGKNVGKAERAPMCGVPYHAAESYIDKLVALGYKVAICEQVGEIGGRDPVERSVVRVVTAGTVTDGNLLQENKNNFLMSFYVKDDKLSAAYVDITTGELFLCHYDENVVSNFCDLLCTVEPSQVIGDGEAGRFYRSLQLRQGSPKFEEFFGYAFGFERALESIHNQFGDNAENVFELRANKQDIPALGGLLEYLSETQKRSMRNICKINKIKNDKFMTIDSSTRRNLELVETIRERKKYGSLLWLMDKTKTAMGARNFRYMFDHPLQSVSAINERLDAVEELSKNLIMRDRLSDALEQVRDIERICGKISYGSVNPQELLNLKTSLAQIAPIKEILANVKSKKLVAEKNSLVSFDEIVALLERAIDPQATSMTREGGYIRKGFNEELDSLKDSHKTAQQKMDALQDAERAATGLKMLKVDHNNVFGFFIEVPKSQAEQVPIRYSRKQTLANSERFTTPELKEIENQFFSAAEEAEKLELKLYKMLIEYLCKFLEKFCDVAKVLAEIDSLLCLATVAVKNNFCKPSVNKSGAIKIVDGRHPIVQNFTKNFIANDTTLDGGENKMMVITGPNMAGKSTYMRQVAIITFLAHIGSFVPAKSAEISITDRIFTRVGASDDLAFGQSTFMVEMSEVANILQNATSKSLVVLDEIGRGTSTFDGLAIAWAVVEYICKNLSCRTLFATHYHELSELEGLIFGVKNYQISVKEKDDSIVFLRKIVRGSANKSFGVEVAKLAGVPEKVIERAKEISVNLERVNQKLDMDIFGEDEEKRKAQKNAKLAMSVLNSLKDIDMNRVSPMESFEILNNLVSRAKDQP